MLGTKTEFEVTEMQVVLSENVSLNVTDQVSDQVSKMQVVLGNDVGGDFEVDEKRESEEFKGYARASPSSIGNEVTMLEAGVTMLEMGGEVMENGGGDVLKEELT